jgi:hypothetical protein
VFDAREAFLQGGHQIRDRPWFGLDVWDLDFARSAFALDDLYQPAAVAVLIAGGVEVARIASITVTA